MASWFNTVGANGQEREYAIGDLPVEITDPVAGTTTKTELQVARVVEVEHQTTAVCFAGKITISPISRGQEEKLIIDHHIE